MKEGQSPAHDGRRRLPQVGGREGRRDPEPGPVGRRRRRFPGCCTPEVKDREAPDAVRTPDGRPAAGRGKGTAVCGQQL